MEQSAIERFKVIGRCSEMQTFSLDQEVSLWEGIHYDIDFSQNFSNIYLDGLPLTDIPVAALTEAIVNPPNKFAIPCAEGRPEKHFNWDYFEKEEKKDRKREKKWKKRHPKYLGAKAAWNNFVRVCEDITGDVI